MGGQGVILMFKCLKYPFEDEFELALSVAHDYLVWESMYAVAVCIDISETMLEYV